MSAIGVTAGREEQVSHGFLLLGYLQKLVISVVAAVVEGVEAHATSSRCITLIMLVQEEEVERNDCSILRGCQIAQDESLPPAIDRCITILYELSGRFFINCPSLK